MSRRRWLLILVALALGAGAAPAWASSIEFSGTSDGKGVHLQSQGRVNFEWVPLTSTSGAPSDPANSLYWGANDLHVFDAIGQAFGTYTLQAGDSFTGLNYTLPMWLGTPPLPNINAQDQTTSDYTSWVSTGTMHISSISFPSDYQIVIGGQITDILNQLTGSALLSDMQSAPSLDFTINVVSSYRTDQSLDQGFLTALNSGNLSSWANIDGAITSSASSAVVPEPATLYTLASALLAGAFLARRRRKAWQALRVGGSLA